MLVRLGAQWNLARNSARRLNKMKKLKTTRSVRIKVAEKRTKRALHSKAKRTHRMSTGFKEIEEKSES